MVDVGEACYCLLLKQLRILWTWGEGQSAAIIFIASKTVYVTACYENDS